MEKRAFLKGLTGLGLSTPLTFNHLDTLMSSISHLSDNALATQEDFWLKIRADYGLKIRLHQLRKWLLLYHAKIHRTTLHRTCEGN